jgi:orotidine-5'-phosphate decarboxylase
MTRQQLVAQIRQKRSYLCVGLDTDIRKIPPHLLEGPDPVLHFNKAIIDATRDHCVAYKINTAFYEAMGAKGWEIMDATVRYIGKEHFTIADAKRGDIGNTSDQYARAFFESMPFDSVTVAPYMGRDSVEPFLQYEGKWAIVLGLTSNEGSRDFQKLDLFDADKINNSLKNLVLSPLVLEKGRDTELYKEVLRKVASWGTKENLMFVIGATQPEEFDAIRQIIPDHFLLVPGVGAQGGSLKEISEKAMTEDCGILVNSSRAIIYASSGTDYAVKAQAMAIAVQQEMAGYLI